MATAKYNPNPINYGIIPKQWLNTPVMSSEEAFMELEKLQNAELVNDIGGQNLEKITRQNDSEEALGQEYERLLEEKKAKGLEEVLSADDALNMVRANQAKYGRADALANDEIARMELQMRQEERDRKAKEKDYKIFGEGSGIGYTDPETGDFKIIREPQRKPKEGKEEFFIDPTTGKAQAAKEEAEKEFLKSRGFIPIGKVKAETDYNKAQIMAEALGPANPSGGKPEFSDEAPVVKKKVVKVFRKKQ